MIHSDEMKTIWICDDNSIHLNRTMTFVDNYIKGKMDWNVRVIGADSFPDTMDMGETRIDILIADIDLGNSTFNGIDISERVNKAYPECQVIYLTSYAGYATKVYETEHIYFVLKNEMVEFLPKAIDKAMLRKKEERPTIMVRGGGSKQMIQLADISYFEKEKGCHKTRIITADNQFELTETLKEIEKNWPDSLIRCHYSFLINPGQVKAWTKDYFELKTGEKIPIGRQFRKLAKEAYMHFIQRLADRNFR